MTFEEGLIELVKTSGGISPQRLAKDVTWAWNGEVTEEQVKSAINQIVAEHKVVFNGRWLQIVR